MEITKYVLVDYENVQEIDVKKVKEDVKMLIFVGANQKNIPIELVQKTQHRGENIQWIRIIKSGKNAADFFITYYLGTLISQKQTEFFIYSKDKGFDPLVEFLKTKNKKIRRIVNLNEMDSEEIISEQIDDNVNKVIENLKKRANKPTTKEKLSHLIEKSCIRKELEGKSEKEIQCEMDRIIFRLEEMNIISFDENGKRKK